MNMIAFLLCFSIVAPPETAPEGVILLHGLCRSDASMKKMAQRLGDAGFVVENVSYPSRTADVETLAANAIESALANPSLADCPRIHFVTHSLGGILVRAHYSKRDRGRLGRVVMLGPPNQGSEVVDALKPWRFFNKLNGPAGKELGTTADSTPNRLGPVNFECGVIAGDRSVNWINSLAMIRGKDDGKVSVERTKVEGMKEHVVVHTTHTFMMRNREVIEKTIRFLKTGSFMEESASKARTE